MLLEILKYPHPDLTTPCRPVLYFSAYRNFVDDMIETMVANKGRGLAAPQVGKLVRIFVFRNDGGEIITCINPVIYDKKGIRIGLEGCLSIPGKQYEVERADSLTLDYFDYNSLGNTPTLVPLNYYHLDKISRSFTGESAVTIQHEEDHLQGLLINRFKEYTHGQEKK